MTGFTTGSGGIEPGIAQIVISERGTQFSRKRALFVAVVGQTKLMQITLHEINIARGAALMTDTTLTVRFDKACSDYVPNRALERKTLCSRRHPADIADVGGAIKQLTRDRIGRDLIHKQLVAQLFSPGVTGFTTGSGGIEPQCRPNRW